MTIITTLRNCIKHDAEDESFKMVDSRSTIPGALEKELSAAGATRKMVLCLLANLNEEARSIGPKVVELRTGLRVVPLQPYVNGRGGGSPPARKFNVSRLGLYSLWSPGLGLGWRTLLG